MSKRAPNPGGAGKGRRKPPATKRSATPPKGVNRRTAGGPRAGGSGAGRAGRGDPNQKSQNRSAASGGGWDGRTVRTGLGGDQVEGLNSVRELLIANTRRTYEVLVSTDRTDAPVLDDILELTRQFQVPVRELSRTKIGQIARTTSHQGVIALAAALDETDYDELLRPSGTASPFLLACDGLTDPGNLGALLRTAESAGVTGVVLPRHRSVHVTPAVTKAAAGAVEHLDFAVVGGMPTAIQQATDSGMLVVGLDMGGDVSVHSLPPVDGPVMVVVGAEGKGLGRLVRQRCDVVASIPMIGATESLNVSVAGALAIYEVVRQRGLAGR